MKGVILNSGVGSRLGEMTASRPKGLTPLATGQTILSRQLEQLWSVGVKEFVITTGPFADAIEEESQRTLPGAEFQFVNNADYATTNYIHSLDLAADDLRGDAVLLMHGDLVFEDGVLGSLLEQNGSVVAVDSSQPLPEKDFKGRLEDGRVVEIGVDTARGDLVALQPLYRLNPAEWNAWLDAIRMFCERGETGVYAENAFNENSDRIRLFPFDLAGMYCQEIDTLEDLKATNNEIIEGNL